MFDSLKNKIHILQNIYLKNKYFIKRKSYAMDGEDTAINLFNNAQTLAASVAEKSLSRRI